MLRMTERTVAFRHCPTEASSAETGTFDAGACSFQASRHRRKVGGGERLIVGTLLGFVIFRGELTLFCVTAIVRQLLGGT